MIVEQIYTGCLSQGAYYIESRGEVAIIDPLREVSPYLERAKANGANIKYIFETHFHADFVSGHVTLAEKTGAPIVFGPNANPLFDAHIATDGELLPLGDLTIKVLHTPGHTMESTTYLLLDETGKEIAIFTGDTLFLGDVGRPDLAQKSDDLTVEDLAGFLYDSLRSKIMPLPDSVTVYPAHGAGSACGKNMMKETVDTLGNQKKMNYALRADMTKAEFIKELTDGLLPPPPYFPLNVQLNREGYKSIEEVLESGSIELSPVEFSLIAKDSGALILDVRKPEEFASGHIPGSIFVGLDGSFAPWVGELIVDVQQEILLVAPEGREKEAVTRLARVGFDHTLGYLSGSIEAWTKADMPIETIESITAATLVKDHSKTNNTIFDVRKVSEHSSHNVHDSVNIPLSALNENMSRFPIDGSFYVHCAGGYRSMIACSILKARGIKKSVNVKGGFKAIATTDIPMSEFVCPSTMG